MIRDLYILVIGILFPFCLTVAFLNEAVTTKNFSRSRYFHPVYGVPEWKAKFSPPANSTLTSQPSCGTALPLLLLPFEPTQIPLPGQHVKMIFRHGKYMDMIDESLTSYESVVGMSASNQATLLPIVVVCEVIEEELIIKSGYRGFSSMEVGLRAVGRMLRECAVQDAKAANNSPSTDGDFQGGESSYYIERGHFIEYQDDELTESEVELCLRYLRSIESFLNLPHRFLTTSRKEDQLSGKQKLYIDVYSYLASEMTKVKCGDIIAASWAVFTFLDDDAKIPSVITQTLSSRNTAERLRLGLASILDSAQSSICEDYNKDNAFQ